MGTRREWLATYHEGDPRLKKSRHGLLQLNQDKLRIEFAVQTTKTNDSPLIIVSYPLKYLQSVQVVEKRQKMKKKRFLQLLLGSPPDEIRPLFSFGLEDAQDIKTEVQSFMDNNRAASKTDSSEMEPDVLETLAQLLMTPINQIQQLFEPIRAVTSRILSFATRPLAASLEPQFDYETRTIELNGRQVTFFETSKSHPLALVLLSPIGGQIQDIFPLIGSFLGNYQVFIVGVRGFTPPIEQDVEFTLKSYVQDLKDFLHYIGSEQERKIVLCAHSILSAVVLEEFVRPEYSNITKFVLISGAHKAPDNFRSGIRALPSPKMWLFKGQVKKIAPKLLFARNANRELTRPYIDHAFTIPDSIYYNLLKDFIPRFDYTKQIRGLKKPLLLVWGEKDGLIPTSIREEMVEISPSGVLTHRVIPGGHYVMLESPENVGSEINKFISNRIVIPIE